MRTPRPDKKTPSAHRAQAPSDAAEAVRPKMIGESKNSAGRASGDAGTTGRGLAVTDALILTSKITDEARLYLAVAVNTPGNDPSGKMIRSLVPLNDGAIYRVRTGLRASGAAVPIQRKTRRENGSTRQLTTKLEKISPEYRLSKTNFYTVIPWALFEPLRGRKNAVRATRLLLLYSLEQRLKGAIALPPEVVAFLFVWTTDEVKKAHRMLLRAGIIRRVEVANPSVAAFVIDGAHPTGAADPERFNSFSVTALHPIAVGGWEITLIGTDTQALWLQSLADQADPRALLAALETHDGGTIQGRSLSFTALDPLAVQGEGEPRSGRTLEPFRENPRAVQGEHSLSLSSYLVTHKGDRAFGAAEEEDESAVTSSGPVAESGPEGKSFFVGKEGEGQHHAPAPAQTLDDWQGVSAETAEIAEAVDAALAEHPGEHPLQVIYPGDTADVVTCTKTVELRDCLRRAGASLY